VSAIHEDTWVYVYRTSTNDMGVLGTISDVLEASTESANRGGGTGDGSKGAYWCHDCSERIRDVDVEGEGPPACPECDGAMEFERSPSSTGCAC
jgi:hypothetical protein